MAKQHTPTERLQMAIENYRLDHYSDYSVPKFNPRITDIEAVLEQRKNLLAAGERLNKAVVDFFTAMNNGTHKPELSRELNVALVEHTTAIAMARGQ